MDISWSALVEVLGGGSVFGLGYWVNRNDRRLDKAEESVDDVKERLNRHMISSQEQWTDAEKRFAKEDTVQSTLARLHDRIDNTASKDDIIEVRNDIKGLLKVVKG